MGGYNSGGGRCAPKLSYYLDLDLATLKRLGLDSPGRQGTLIWFSRGEQRASVGVWMGDDACVLTYQTKARGGEWEQVSETIFIDKTAAGFDGHRRWFLCPRCAKRCRKLYGAGRFRCRTCRGAVYDSQYDPFFHARHERSRRIRRRLGDSSGDIWSSVPRKPKGMHWKTYWRLSDELFREQMKFEDGMQAYMKVKGWLHLF